MDKLSSGYQRTNHIRLDSEAVKIDKTSLLGASTMAQLLKAGRTGDYSNVGNALTLYGAVTEIDPRAAAADRFVSSEQTITVVTDAANVEHRLTDAAMVTAYVAQGMTITKTETVKTWSDGTVTTE